MQDLKCEEFVKSYQITKKEIVLLLPVWGCDNMSGISYVNTKGT